MKSECGVTRYKLPKDQNRIRKNLAIFKQSNKIYASRPQTIYEITFADIPVIDGEESLMAGEGEGSIKKTENFDSTFSKKEGYTVDWMRRMNVEHTTGSSNNASIE